MWAWDPTQRRGDVAEEGWEQLAVVRLDWRRETAVVALRRAGTEDVQEYMTCREGDAQGLPVTNGYFGVVVSVVHLSRLEGGGAAVELAAGLGLDLVVLEEVLEVVVVPVVRGGLGGCGGAGGGLGPWWWWWCRAAGGGLYFSLDSSKLRFDRSSRTPGRSSRRFGQRIDHLCISHLKEQARDCKNLR
ncbi:hypothetical protein J5N97_004199 [Dioscorea zingiberensis]|uniref:Uncharacterized protein n=1 Tax=Dioscorea zingiberensis TaxID=325984 RepID=A0A9D5D671_9LILI|nr:hypothetical protein J5N97_004199 [Dioscorea zingiberensis]